MSRQLMGPRRWRQLGQAALFKATRLVVAGLLLGWFYAWAAPKFYPPDRVVGFGYGVLEGALMPMALPSLLMGKEVPIYSQRNTGRTYKLGYIVGINLCGLLFFGLAFAQPRRVRCRPPEAQPEPPP